jgi:hypothetical protein
MLRTYEHPKDHHFVSVNSTDDNMCLAVNMKPGEWVKDATFGGLGLLVANGDDFITILWSKFPGMPDTGFVHAPYVPALKEPVTQFTPEDFAPRKGIMTRYGKTAINPNFYGTINILDMFPSGSK